MVQAEKAPERLGKFLVPNSVFLSQRTSAWLSGALTCGKGNAIQLCMWLRIDQEGMC